MMTLQTSVRAIRNGERTLFAGTAVSFASAINDGSRTFFARFMAALAESRRREGERTIRCYSHLLDDHKP
jgi:hypothetical protein